MVHRGRRFEEMRSKALTGTARAKEEDCYLLTFSTGGAAAVAKVGGIALAVSDAGSGVCGCRSNNIGYEWESNHGSRTESSEKSAPRYGDRSARRGV
jgi:hypothetical protein